VPWLELLGAGVTNFLGINFLTISFQQGMPATTAVLTYISVFYNYLADLAFFEVNFSVWQYIGMAVTLCFSLTPAVIKLQKEWKNK
jgi:drug/metabolite transporter (DMT)-like permease